MNDDRYEIVNSCQIRIIEDCRIQIQLFGTADQKVFGEIADALDAGLFRAAQALAMNVVESILRTRFDPTVATLVRQRGSVEEVHATAHEGISSQYSKTNAVLGLLLAICTHHVADLVPSISME